MLKFEISLKLNYESYSLFILLIIKPITNTVIGNLLVCKKQKLNTLVNLSFKRLNFISVYIAYRFKKTVKYTYLFGRMYKKILKNRVTYLNFADLEKII